MSAKILLLGIGYYLSTKEISVSNINILTKVINFTSGVKISTLNTSIPDEYRIIAYAISNIDMILSIDTPAYKINKISLIFNFYKINYKIKIGPILTESITNLP